MQDQDYAQSVDTIRDAKRNARWYHLKTPSCNVDSDVEQLVRWDNERGLWQAIFMVNDEDGNAIDDLCEGIYIFEDGSRFSDTILT